MNLLEHYILEVININELQMPEHIKEHYIEVEALCDCWGDKRVVKHFTTKAGWDQDLKRGYFMA